MPSFCPSVTDEDILAYYSNPNCKGIPFRASSYLGVGVRRVLRVWEEYGKKPRSLRTNDPRRKSPPSNLVGVEPRNRLANVNEKDLELIVSRYDTYHGIPPLAARSLPYGTEVIKAAWMQAGKEIKRNDSY